MGILQVPIRNTLDPGDLDCDRRSSTNALAYERILGAFDVLWVAVGGIK
jgi:hypothetical protein